MIFMTVQPSAYYEKLHCNSSCAAYSLRKNTEKLKEGVAEPVLDNENPSFQDDPTKCKYQTENQRYSSLSCLHQ